MNVVSDVSVFATAFVYGSELDAVAGAGLQEAVGVASAVVAGVGAEAGDGNFVSDAGGLVVLSVVIMVDICSCLAESYPVGCPFCLVAAFFFVGADTVLVVVDGVCVGVLKDGFDGVLFLG